MRRRFPFVGAGDVKWIFSLPFSPLQTASVLVWIGRWSIACFIVGCTWDSTTDAELGGGADTPAVIIRDPSRVGSSPPEEASVALPRFPVRMTAEEYRQEAQAVAESLVEDYGESAEALHVAALLAAQTRKISDAEAFWQRASEKSAEPTRYLVNLAVLALERGDHQRARDFLRPLVEDGSQSRDVLYHYGLAATRSGELDEAKDVYEKAVGLFPQDGQFWAGLAEAQLQAGDPQAAVMAFQNARQLGVDTPELFFQLANAARALGEKDLEAESMQAFEERKQQSTVAPEQRFEILSENEARATLITVLVEAAAVLSKMGDTPGAEMLLLRAVAVDPSQMEVCRTLADFYGNLANFVDEAVVRSHMVAMVPSRVDYHIRLAKTLALQDRTADAEATLKLVLSQHPDDVLCYVALAEFLASVDRPEKAVVYAKKAIDRQPTVEGYQFLAKLYHNLDNETAAAEAEAEMRRLGTSRERSSVAP